MHHRSPPQRPGAGGGDDLPLTDDHNNQLGDYLRWLRRKRENAIAEVAAEFNDLKEQRLFDDQYHVDDVIAMLDGLVGMVKSSLKRDLQSTAFSSVLLMKQVMEQAESHRVSLRTDLPTTEDRGLLAAVEQWDQSVHGGGGAAPSLRARAAIESGGGGRSRSLAPVGAAQDPRLLADLQSTQAENLTLQERYNRLQQQCSAALRDKSDLQARLDALGGGGGRGGGGGGEELEMLRQEVGELRSELQAAYDQQDQMRQQGGGGGGGHASESLMRELHDAQDANAALTDELNAARTALDGRIEKSPAFRNLQKMLQTKQQQVRQLRETLSAHGIYVDDIGAED